MWHLLSRWRSRSKRGASLEHSQSEETEDGPPPASVTSNGTEPSVDEAPAIIEVNVEKQGYVFR